MVIELNEDIKTRPKTFRSISQNLNINITPVRPGAEVGTGKKTWSEDGSAHGATGSWKQ